MQILIINGYIYNEIYVTICESLNKNVEMNEIFFLINCIFFQIMNLQQMG